MDVVPGDRSLAARCVAASFGALAWIAACLRFYVRLKVVKNFGWDDKLIALALVFYTGLCGCMIAASHYGTGQHEANLTQDNIIIALRLWWLCEVFYGMASVALKASVCLFLLRIAVRKYHVWTLYLVMTVTVMTGFVFLLVLLLQCHPISHFWEREGEGHCISWNVIIAMSWLWSIFAASCDFTVGILPIFLVKDLQMDVRTKVAVALILGVACIASSAVIIRMPFLHTFSNPDFLYATTDIALWTNIELGLGIFASSVATLRPLLRVVRNKGNYASNQYPNGSRLHSNSHNINSFKRMQSEHSGDLATTFGLPNKGTVLTTVHGAAGGYDASGSESALNQMSHEQVPYGEYHVKKTFEVTATERTAAESV